MKQGFIEVIDIPSNRLLSINVQHIVMVQSNDDEMTSIWVAGVVTPIKSSQNFNQVTLLIEQAIYET